MKNLYKTVGQYIDLYASEIHHVLLFIIELISAAGCITLAAHSFMGYQCSTGLSILFCIINTFLILAGIYTIMISFTTDPGSAAIKQMRKGMYRSAYGAICFFILLLPKAFM